MKCSSLLLGLTLAVFTASTCLAAASGDPFFETPKANEAEYAFSGASQPHGVFYPGEVAVIKLTVPKAPKSSIAGGAIEIVSIHTRTQTPGEIGFFSDYGKPRLTPGIKPIRVPLNPGPPNDGMLEVTLPLPETFGTYALVLQRADGTRTMLGNVVRVLKPTPRLGAIPQLMSSGGSHGSFGAPALQQRLGVGLLRSEVHWDASAPGAEFMRLTWAQLGFATPPKAGQDFGLTCRWNSDGGVDLGGSYAATKSNGLTLHPYWQASPSNTVRWTLLP